MLAPQGPQPPVLPLQRSKLMSRVWTSVSTSRAPGLASSRCVWALTSTPSDKIPQPTHGCPPTPAKCHRRNVVAAGLESQDRNTQDTYVRLGSASRKGEARTGHGVWGWVGEGVGSEETRTGDSAHCSVGMQCVLPSKTNSSSRFISLWRRNNQQDEVSEKGGHVLLPKPRGLCQGQPGRAEFQEHPEWRPLVAPWRGEAPTLCEPVQPHPELSWGWWPPGRHSSCGKGKRLRGDNLKQR